MGSGLRGLVGLPLLLVAGCAGSGKVEPCGALSCATGRVCVAGRCVEPDGRTTASPEAAVSLEASATPDHAREKPAGDAPAVVVDNGPACPDPTSVAGSYAGTFADALGGGLAQGTLAFTLQAGGVQGLTLGGTINGTALPGTKNYSIQGNLTGTVTCATLTSKLTGKLDGNAFSGQLDGTLKGSTASGFWNGTGSGITVAGTWTAARK